MRIQVTLNDWSFFSDVSCFAQALCFNSVLQNLAMLCSAVMFVPFKGNVGDNCFLTAPQEQSGSRLQA